MLGKALLRGGHVLDFSGDDCCYVVEAPCGVLQPLDALAETRLLVHRCFCVSWLLKLDQPVAAARLDIANATAPEARGQDGKPTRTKRPRHPRSARVLTPRRAVAFDHAKSRRQRQPSSGTVRSPSRATTYLLATLAGTLREGIEARRAETATLLPASVQKVSNQVQLFSSPRCGLRRARARRRPSGARPKGMTNKIL